MSALARRFDEWLRKGLGWPVLAGAAVLVMVVAALVHRHLYADGANFLVLVLEQRSFTTFDPGRHWAQCGLETPLWLAIHGFCITDVRVLSWVFGLTLFLHPLVSLWACWRILRRRGRALLFLPALGWLGLTLTTSFFVISESWLGVSLFWPIYFLLLFQHHRLTGLEGLLLVAGSFVAIRTYEGFCVPALLLLWLAVRRVRWQWNVAQRLDGFALVAAGCLLASVTAGVWLILYPQNVANRASFVKGVTNVFSYPGAHLFVAAVLLLAGPRWLRTRAAGPLGGCLLVLAIVWAAAAWLLPSTLASHKHANLRVLNVIVPFGLGLLPLVAARWPSWRPTFDRPRQRLFAGLAVAVLLWQLGSSIAWTRYTSAFETVLAERTGFVPYEQTDLAQFGFQWDWTPPTLSLVLRTIAGQPVRAIVLPPLDCGWQPFDAKDPAQRPQLTGFGLRYELGASGR